MSANPIKPLKLASTGEIQQAVSTDAVSAASGGTGYNTFAQGDILIGNGSGSLTTLPVGSTGQVLEVTGTNTVGWANPAAELPTANATGSEEYLGSASGGYALRTASQVLSDIGALPAASPTYTGTLTGPAASIPQSQINFSGTANQYVNGAGTDTTLPQLVSVTNDNAAALPPGTPVYSSAAGHVNMAQANSSPAWYPVGLATSSIAASATGYVQTGQVLTLTTAQWDAVAGTSGGLSFGIRYFVSATTAGLITATAPGTVGQRIAPVGRALSSTQLLVDFSGGVLL